MNKLTMLTIALTSMLTSVSFGQGSLNPPGAPAATMKSLAQVEPRTPITNIPYTIYSAGSYYLTQSFSNSGNTNAITIAASDVSLDLMGYKLTGVGVGSEKAIEQTSGNRATVRNGTIRIFTSGGISLGDYATVENITVADSGGTSVSVGQGSRVHAVKSFKNGTGIVLGNHSRLTDSIVMGSTSGHGVSASQGSLVTGSISISNNMDGFYFPNNGFIKESSADFNGSFGIHGDDGLIVTDCRTFGNDSTGIWVEDNGVVQDCFSAGNNSFQIVVSHKSTVESSHAIGTIRASGTNIVIRNVVHAGSISINSDSVSGWPVTLTAGDAAVSSDRPLSNLRYDP